MKKLLITIVAITTLTLFATPASAVLIQGLANPIKNTAQLTWEVNSDGNLVITIENTSEYLAEINSFRFGFAGSPNNVDSMLSSTGIEGASTVWRATMRANNTRVRARNRGYVGVGATGTFTFVGDFSDLSTLANIAVRFRRVGKDQNRRDVGYQCRVECEPAEVPEPGTMALFGLGLLGLRAAKKRRLA